MEIISKTSKSDIATVYIAKMKNGKLIEFVESTQPPLTIDKKWVIIVSTLYGCPVKCKICDAGKNYSGKLSKEDILKQIDYPVLKRFSNRKVNVEKFKIQFARMGEPAFNNNVIECLKELKTRYSNNSIIPSISTIAPIGTEKFFSNLLEVKNKYYNNNFQLQFSIHTTDIKLRDWLIPVKKWSFKAISEFGNDFYSKNNRKITLNFALAKNMPLDPVYLSKFFDIDKFIIKITPINPTYQAYKNKMESYVLHKKTKYEIINLLESIGYEVILSVGELKENHIGSNCGQYITNHLNNNIKLKNSYTYSIEKVN